MSVSEKSLELNVGAEILGIMRNQLGLPKAYLRGLTQGEERQEGADFFVELDPTTKVFAFQFKRPKGPFEHAPYTYTLKREQHKELFRLAEASPASTYYVFPFYVTPQKLAGIGSTQFQKDQALRKLHRHPTRPKPVSLSPLVRKKSAHQRGGDSSRSRNGAENPYPLD